MNRVLLSLGSNIDKEVNLPQAVRLLAESGNILAVSSVYETAAQGTVDQPSFFNAAVLLETPLAPEKIKDQVIAGIEHRLKRQRQADKNAPRTIDIDIALFNEAILDYIPADGRRRHVPDPDLLRARHMLVPAAEIIPDFIHPETGETLSEIAERLASSAAGMQRIRRRDDIDLGV